MQNIIALSIVSLVVGYALYRIFFGVRKGTKGGGGCSGGCNC